MWAVRRRRLCLPPHIGAVGQTAPSPSRIDQEASKELACTEYSKEYIRCNYLPKTLTGLCKPREPLTNSRLVVVNCLCEFGWIDQNCIDWILHWIPIFAYCNVSSTWRFVRSAISCHRNFSNVKLPYGIDISNACKYRMMCMWSPHVWMSVIHDEMFDVHGTMMMIHIAFAHKHNNEYNKMFDIPA